MKKNTPDFWHWIRTKTAFTLVEVLITITILALIFTSVMSVFIYYTTLWAKVEANRLLQSNIKNIIEHISKDIKDNGINIGGMKHDFSGLYDGGVPGANNNSEDLGILYVWDNMYYIARLLNPDVEYVAWAVNQWKRVEPADYQDQCVQMERLPTQQKCVLLKEKIIEGDTNIKIPLSNSWVSFRSMYFYVSEDYIPKVTINFNMGIAEGKWLQEDVIKANNIQIQTTISEKLLDQNI